MFLTEQNQNIDIRHLFLALVNMEKFQVTLNLVYSLLTISEISVEVL